MHEVYDLAWSPCTQYILVGSMDGKSEVIHIHKKDSIMLPNHTSYVQGVAWDPCNRILVTQSADRSVRVHQVRVVWELGYDISMGMNMMGMGMNMVIEYGYGHGYGSIWV
ncbi:hypothetical protein EON65_13740 [archaeon]|nr:MAG: hypothetical protein EON65_13740 [archaeon]